MSPVFRHGRLRLYLLKLLDEAPRHGYEVIRLLQDRFLGVYAPSPGTIYPRLARLEEDGLVTHEEVDGKKVYSITEKGREEIRNRFSDLTDLEDELTESLRDVAREISEDVRDTVRGIREDLAAAARDIRGQQGDRMSPDAARNPSAPGSGFDDASPRPGRAGKDGDDDSAFGAEEARRIREEARRTREEMRAKFRARNRGADWAGWQERASRGDWGGWSAPWSAWTEAGRPDDTGSGGPQEGGPEAGGPKADAPDGADQSKGDQRTGRGQGNRFTDLERMAIQFATELRTAAKQAGNVGERSLNDLRDILTDTLTKVRVEVFADGDTKPDPPAGSNAAGSSAAGSSAAGSSAAGSSAAQSDKAEPGSADKPSAADQPGDPA
jgi:DNA-binding PadR family transcriptional regulator